MMMTTLNRVFLSYKFNRSYRTQSFYDNFLSSLKEERILKTINSTIQFAQNNRSDCINILSNTNLFILNKHNSYDLNYLYFLKYNENFKNSIFNNVNIENYVFNICYNITTLSNNIFFRDNTDSEKTLYYDFIKMKYLGSLFIINPTSNMLISDLILLKMYYTKYPNIHVDTEKITICIKRHLSNNTLFY